MADRTDNAQGPERIWFNDARPAEHRYVSRSRFAGGIEYVRADLASELFVSRPDNTVGIAYLDCKGFPLTDTVCSTERGAMVNYLVTVCGITPMADWSDAKIRAQFDKHKMGGSVGPVSIERLIVEQDPT